MGRAPKKIPHWEHWSNPDAETALTGIDYYEHPRLCRMEMRRLYPQLGLGIPEDDAPRPRPSLSGERSSTDHATVRWGDSETATWRHGEDFFKTEEEVFALSPLAHADMREWPHVVNNWDFSSEEILMRQLCPGGAGPTPEDDSGVGIYNTMFMWPLLTFGWELFLACCLDERFERIMDEFAELNRRAFRTFARMPVKFVHCHDDIVMTRGPVCPPWWMKKYIYARYEEFFGIVRASGKEVIFMTDGCADQVADDVMACGARGIISEPYTDYKALASRHKDCFCAGEGHNRILTGGGREDVRRMVESMVKTAGMTGGYMMCVGNHIPWNVPADNIKYYLDFAAELAHR